MKKIFNIKNKILLTAGLLLVFSNAYSLPTIHYGYPKVNNNLEECLSAANTSLSKAGYKITQKTKQHVLAYKGKFFIATIVCATYKSGIAFIIVNGRGSDSNPMYEQKLIQNTFSRNIKNF